MVTTGSGHPLVIKSFAQTEYSDSYASMARFANERAVDEPDQIWFLQHAPVYTQGTACKQETLLPSDIPVVKTDRGGQITYHGPGQLVMYPLLTLKRYGIGVKALVAALEQAVIDTLVDFDVVGERRSDAPGVYVDGAKIAALGLRIRRGTSYHGLSFNIKMDLQPFDNIDPCGYQGLKVTQLADCYHRSIGMQNVQQRLLARFIALI